MFKKYMYFHIIFFSGLLTLLTISAKLQIKIKQIHMFVLRIFIHKSFPFLNFHIKKMLTF